MDYDDGYGYCSSGAGYLDDYDLEGAGLGYESDLLDGYGGGALDGYDAEYGTYDSLDLADTGLDLVGGYGELGARFPSDYGLGSSYGHGRSLSYAGEYGSSGYGGLEDDYLWRETSYLDREVPLIDAWGDRWSDEQYQLADLVSWEDTLARQNLNEAERLRLFQDRLAWEQLADDQRRLRWKSMALDERERLGLQGGWWGHRYGHYDFDVGLLRRVPLRRGLFRHSRLRHLFSRNPLRWKYTPYVSRSAVRVEPRSSMSSSVVSLRRPGLIPQSSAPISTSVPWDLRDRLRLAETRASLTSLGVAERAEAMAAVRRIREEINARQRRAREINRQISTDNALSEAQQVADARAEQLRDMGPRG